MIRTYFLILFLLFYLTSYTQRTITIFNESSKVIDSVVIQGSNFTRKTFDFIEKGTKKLFLVDVESPNFNSTHSYPLYISVFTNAFKWEVFWFKNSLADTIYFSNHGLSSDTNKLHRPETFRLYIFNSTPAQIDTIIAPNNAIIEKHEFSPRSFEIVLDHQKIASIQTVLVKTAERIFKIHLKFLNLNDWNNTVSSVYLEKDSVFLGSPPNADLYEYFVDLVMVDGLRAKDIQITANQPIKTYVNYGETIIRAFFEYKKFKSDPKFIVNLGKKKYVIKVKAIDIENKMYPQYWISKNKIERR